MRDLLDRLLFSLAFWCDQITPEAEAWLTAAVCLAMIGGAIWIVFFNQTF